MYFFGKETNFIMRYLKSRFIGFRDKKFNISIRFSAIKIMLLLCLSGPLAGCATLVRLAPAPVKCHLDASGQQLVIAGATDAKMLACVEKNLSKNVDVLEISSLGGRVSTAILIAEHIAPYKLHIKVKSYCSSSCANYILPTARQITVLPKAQIVIHGSIDESFAEKMKQEHTDTATGKSWDFSPIVDKQTHFVQKYNVPLGWLLYRTADDYKTKANSRYIEGDFHRWANNSDTVKSLLVEETFMRSCLTHIIIDPFVETDSQKIYTDTRMQRRFAKQGVFPTGDMLCYSP